MVVVYLHSHDENLKVIFSFITWLAAQNLSPLNELTKLCQLCRYIAKLKHNSSVF